MSFYDLCQTLVVDVWVHYKVMCIVLYFIGRALYGFYLYLQTYNHWWVGLLPAGHLIVKGELSALSIIAQCLYVIFGALSFITMFSLPLLIPFLLISIYTDVRFCYMYIDNMNKYIYGLVPFAKYVYMIKEVFVICLQN